MASFHAGYGLGLVQSSVAKIVSICAWVYCVLPSRKLGVDPLNFTKVFDPSKEYLNVLTEVSCTRSKSIDGTSEELRITYFILRELSWKRLLRLRLSRLNYLKILDLRLFQLPHRLQEIRQMSYCHQFHLPYATRFRD